MKILCGDKRDVDKCDEILSKTNKITMHKNNNNNNIHKRSKSLSNKKTDKIDYGGMDGHTSTTTATITSAIAKSRSPNKRVQKIDNGSGGGVGSSTATSDSFTLPRVVLRQR